MMAAFRELTGSYSDGQRVTPVEYTDFFEPIGTSFARYPDGAGGPFLYTFTWQGTLVSSIGWVISSAGRRLGTWQLWGLICEGRALPAAALPLLWRFLRRRDELQRMKTEAEKIDESFWEEDELADWLSKVPREPREEFRKALRGALLTAYSKYTPGNAAIPVEVIPETIDVLPWLALLGSVPPETAQLRPRPFYDATGYAYTLKPAGTKIEVPRISSVIANSVDDAIRLLYEDPASASARAKDIRQLIRRGPSEPPAPPQPLPPLFVEPARPHQKPEPAANLEPEVSEPPPHRDGIPEFSYVAQDEKASKFLWDVIGKRTLLYLHAAVPYLALVLAVWTFWQMTHLEDIFRQYLAVQAREAAALKAEIARLRANNVGGTGTLTTTTGEPPPTLAARLAASPPSGIVLDAQLREDLKKPDFDRIRLAATAVEIYMRLEGCRTTSESVNGLVRDERQYVTDCSKLKQAGLLTNDGDFISAKCLEWLETRVPR